MCCSECFTLISLLPSQPKRSFHVAASPLRCNDGWWKASRISALELPSFCTQAGWGEVPCPRPGNYLLCRPHQINLSTPRASASPLSSKGPSFPRDRDLSPGQHRLQRAGNVQHGKVTQQPSRCPLQGQTPLRMKVQVLCPCACSAPSTEPGEGQRAF